MQRSVERYTENYKVAQLFVELGNVPVLFEQLTRFRLYADCARQMFTRISVLSALICTIRFADSVSAPGFAERTGSRFWSEADLWSLGGRIL